MKKSKATGYAMTMACLMAAVPYGLTICLVAAEHANGKSLSGAAGNLAAEVIAFWGLVGGGLVAFVVVGHRLYCFLFGDRRLPWRDVGRESVIVLIALGGFPFSYLVSQSLPKPHQGLWDAVAHRRVATVRSYLMAHPELATVCSDRGKTLLHDCTNTQIAEILLSYGADVNARDLFGTTPLHSASATEYGVTMIPYLVAKGADVNAVDDNGDTPLHHAALLRPDNVGLLLKAGAKPDVRDLSGETPREWAERCIQDHANSCADQHREAIQAIDAAACRSKSASGWQDE